MLDVVWVALISAGAAVATALLTQCLAKHGHRASIDLQAARQRN